ncbi:MAG: cation transporter [Clostridia bacterium]|nr:cation transporter [Clostridia bacterium]
MEIDSGGGNEKREKTLLASLLLSLWAPLATGIAVLMSSSITQLADFIRRSMELLVLFLSWIVFRNLTGKRGVSQESKRKWERIVNLSVAGVLGISGLIMFLLAFLRSQSVKPEGNVLLGLTIAILGLMVNFWFWRRYRSFVSREYNPIIDAQRQLYLAKIFVDICVVLALGTVAFMTSHPVTAYVDVSGSMAVAVYLLWSSARALRMEKRKLDLLVRK